MRMKLVPIKNAILFALEETDPDTGIGTQMINRWAKKAEVEVGLQRMYRKILLINPLENNFMDPPDDAINIKYIYDGDVRNEITKDLSTDPLAEDDGDFDAMGGYVWQPLSQAVLPENMWDLQGGQIMFDTAKVGSILTMDYTAFPTNTSDDIMVPEKHLDAISMYVQYRMARVLRWKMMRSPKMMRGRELYTIREMKEEWIKERNEARADEAAMTPYDKYRIDLYTAELTGSFIQNFD